MMEFNARPLYLPGLILEPGDLIIIVDSRGRVIKGVFRGYASKFIALSDGCNEEPGRFMNIQRVNEIYILKRNYCVQVETQRAGDDSHEGGDK